MYITKQLSKLARCIASSFQFSLPNRPEDVGNKKINLLREFPLHIQRECLKTRFSSDMYTRLKNLNTRVQNTKI